MKQGIVGTDDPYIIAINRSKLEHLDPQIPLILKCLFRLHQQILFTESKKLDAKATESFWKTRDHITKSSGSDTKISMGFFDDPEHSGRCHRESCVERGKENKQVEMGERYGLST